MPKGIKIVCKTYHEVGEKDSLYCLVAVSCPFFEFERILCGLHSS